MLVVQRLNAVCGVVGGRFWMISKAVCGESWILECDDVASTVERIDCYEKLGIRPLRKDNLTTYFE